MTDAEREAIALYAVLARDTVDFYEMARQASPETLRILRLMLSTPNPKHDRRTQKLNAYGLTLLP